MQICATVIFLRFLIYAFYAYFDPTILVHDTHLSILSSYMVRVGHDVTFYVIPPCHRFTLPLFQLGRLLLSLLQLPLPHLCSSFILLYWLLNEPSYFWVLRVLFATNEESVIKPNVLTLSISKMPILSNNFIFDTWQRFVSATHSKDNMLPVLCRADSRLAPSQWETSLQSNANSHWQGANLESALLWHPCHVSKRQCHKRIQFISRHDIDIEQVHPEYSWLNRRFTCFNCFVLKTSLSKIREL